MNCPFCGSPIGSGAASCPNCGAPIPQESSTPSKKVPAWRPDSVTAEHQERAKNSPPPEPTMLWYYFLIYFGLWLSAVWSLYQGVKSLAECFFTKDPALLLTFRLVPAIRYLNIAVGVYCIFIAVYSVIVRQKLAGHSSSGPRTLLTLYGLNCGYAVFVPLALLVLNQVYDLAMSIWNTELVMMLVISGFMFYVNKTYFKKRRKYFNK